VQDDGALPLLGDARRLHRDETDQQEDDGRRGINRRDRPRHADGERCDEQCDGDDIRARYRAPFERDDRGHLRLLRYL
jgi:hypothetical protein